jgi:hypothetical protein
MGKRCSDPNRTIGYRAAHNIPQPTSGSTNSRVYNSTSDACATKRSWDEHAGGKRRQSTELAIHETNHDHNQDGDPQRAVNEPASPRPASHACKTVKENLCWWPRLAWRNIRFLREASNFQQSQLRRGGHRGRPQWPHRCGLSR